MKRSIYKIAVVAVTVIMQTLGVCAVTSCNKTTDTTVKVPDCYTTDWSSQDAWYQSADTINPDKIDLLYIVSTNVISATDSCGATQYRARLTADDRSALGKEMAYVSKNISKGDFNYVAPYYHQFTFEAISLPTAQFQTEYNTVKSEVCDAFDYYMAHVNGGRRFAIVSFSQGGMLVLDLLRHMTDSQYNQLVGAYAIGYRIAKDDLKCRRIVPATDETTPGVTVSFNSVLSADGIWSFVGGDAVAAINPVNWQTDATPATFTYKKSQHKVYLDQTTRQLMVQTDDSTAQSYRAWNDNPVFKGANVNADCLHHWDLLFYTSYLHDNILKRSGK